MSFDAEGLNAQIARQRGRDFGPTKAALESAMNGEVGQYDMDDNEYALACHAAETMIMKGHQPSDPTPYLMSLQPSQVHVNAALSNVAVMWRNREYVADKVMPVIPVPKRSDVYFTWNPETMFQVADVAIAGNRGRPGEITYGLSNTTYTVADFGLMDFVSYDEIANADAPLAPQQSSVEITTNFILLAREIRAANATFSTGNFPGGQNSSLTGSSKWDQFATSDPVNDIETAIEQCLVRPNALVIGAQAWIKLRQHPKLTQFIVARATAGGKDTPMRVTAQMVAEAFELDEVIIGRAKYISTAEGLTKTYSYVWGKHAALIRIEPQPDRRKTETFAYTFRFSGGGVNVPGLGGPTNGGFEVRQIPDQIPGRSGGIWNKVAHADIEQIIGLNASTMGVGYLYQNVVS